MKNISKLCLLTLAVGSVSVSLGESFGVHAIALLGGFAMAAAAIALAYTQKPSI